MRASNKTVEREWSANSPPNKPAGSYILGLGLTAGDAFNRMVMRCRDANPSLFIMG